MEELKRFENDLKNNVELRKKLEEALKRIAEEGQVKSDGEAMVQAARELGYEITIAALEQSKAAAEELDPEELQQVAGGDDSQEEHLKKLEEWCMVDYGCEYDYRKASDDNDGHDWLCLAVWHCFTAAIHTEGGTKYEACWSNHKCGFINE